MREFFRQAVHALEDGQPVALVSLLSAAGSTPRGTGAMMSVFADGSAAGTIGGGMVEWESQKLAGTLLQGQQDCLLRTFDFVPGDAAGLNMACGGTVTVHFQRLAPKDAAAIAALRELITASGAAQGVWLVRRLEGERVTALRCAVTADRADPALSPLLGDRPVLQADGWWSIPVERPGYVYLFGGGHVSQELVPVLAGVGFRPVVWDDRPEFSDPALFPQAERTLCGDFGDISRRLTLTADDDVVVVTRGHQADYQVLTQVLRSPARYLGCIGSRKKLDLCRTRLLEAGFTAEEYQRLHAPIGLPIGAETPAEIAISIAAELIAVRAGASE